MTSNVIDAKAKFLRDGGWASEREFLRDMGVPDADNLTMWAWYVREQGYDSFEQMVKGLGYESERAMWEDGGIGNLSEWAYIPEGIKGGYHFYDPDTPWTPDVISPATTKRTMVLSVRPGSSADASNKYEPILSNLYKNGANSHLDIQMKNNAFGGLFRMKKPDGSYIISSAITAGNFHEKEQVIMVSFDCDSDEGHFYINGTDVGITTADGVSSFSARTAWTLGSSISQENAYEYPNGVDHGNKFSFKDVWIANDYVDFSVQENRELFWKNGKRVNQGNDGSAKTGITPLIYLSGGVDEYNACRNKGSLPDSYMHVVGVGAEHLPHFDKVSYRKTFVLDDTSTGWDKISTGTIDAGVLRTLPPSYVPMFGDGTGQLIACWGNAYNSEWNGVSKDFAVRSDNQRVGQYLPTAAAGDLWVKPAGLTNHLEDVTPIHFHFSQGYALPSSFLRIRIYGDDTDYTAYTQWQMQLTAFGVGHSSVTIHPNDLNMNQTDNVTVSAGAGGAWVAHEGIVRISVEVQDNATYWDDGINDYRNYSLVLEGITQGYGHTPMVVNISDDALRDIDDIHNPIGDPASTRTTRTYAAIGGGTVEDMTIMEAACALGVKFGVSVIAENVLNPDQGLTDYRMKEHFNTGYAYYTTHGHYSLPSLCRVTFDYSGGGTPFTQEHVTRYFATTPEPTGQDGDTAGRLVRIVSTDTDNETQELVISRRGKFLAPPYTTSADPADAGSCGIGDITTANEGTDLGMPLVEDLVDDLDENYQFLISEGYPKSEARHYVYPTGAYRKTDITGGISNYLGDGRYYYSSQIAQILITEALDNVGLLSGRTVDAYAGTLGTGLVPSATNYTIDMRWVPGFNMDKYSNIPGGDYTHFRDEVLPDLVARGAVLYLTMHGARPAGSGGDSDNDTKMDADHYVDIFKYEKDQTEKGNMKIVTVNEMYEAVESTATIGFNDAKGDMV